MSTILQPETAADASLILVHGHDCKPRRGELLAICREALRHGLERDRPDLLEAFTRLTIRMCYYGDLTNALLIADGASYDEELDIADRRNSLASLKSLTKPKHFRMARYDKLPGKSALKEFAADLSSGVLGVLGLTDRVIGAIARDIAAYWRPGSDYARAVQDRLMSEIREALGAGERILLLTHGTGSIVAWDVLWRLSHDAVTAPDTREEKIDTWMTLGCPLGDESVKKRLLGAKHQGRERYPTNILAWHNVAAEDDYLCHDKDMANDYRAMMEERLVSSIRDYRIYNLAVRYGRSNPHSSVGYLIHPRVTQILGDWLQR